MDTYRRTVARSVGALHTQYYSSKLSVEHAVFPRYAIYFCLTNRLWIRSRWQIQGNLELCMVYDAVFAWSQIRSVSGVIVLYYEFLSYFKKHSNKFLFQSKTYVPAFTVNSFCVYVIEPSSIARPHASINSGSTMACNLFFSICGWRRFMGSWHGSFLGYFLK